MTGDIRKTAIVRTQYNDEKWARRRAPVKRQKETIDEKLANGTYQKSKKSSFKKIEEIAQIMNIIQKMQPKHQEKRKRKQPNLKAVKNQQSKPPLASTHEKMMKLAAEKRKRMEYKSAI